jgi:hypothetical protein
MEQSEVLGPMRIHRIICLAAAMVLPQIALAKLPMTNDVFGKSEGTLDFCAQADPASAPKYQARKKALVRDVPEKEVAEARTTKEYKDGYELVTGQLGSLPKDQAVAGCSAVLQSDK